MLAATGLAAAGGHIRFEDLGLHPDVFSIGFFTLRWYSLAYITGILFGWWYLGKMLDRPGAPMSRAHADDLVFYVTLGIILGGRIGYVIFYAPEMFLHPLRIIRLWDGGMSFHGGAAGTGIGVILFARKHKLSWLRILDYLVCTAPVGLFLGRLANFVNGELWGKPSDAPWAIIFPRTVPFGLPDPARHPSQLYEAGLEGLVLFAVMSFAFWRTKARYDPGKLSGLFLLGYGIARFIVEFFREPDQQLRAFAEMTGLHMGQWLCVPMILGGLYLMNSAKARRVRVEPIAGPDSVS